MQRAKTVYEYIEAHPEWQKEISRLRKVAQKTDLEETVKWGAPTYTINNKNVIGIGAFKSYVGLWFFNGALLKDKDKCLINAQEGKTKAMRQWRFANQKEINEKQVLSYLNEAIELQKAGKVVKKAAPKADVDVPEEL